MVDVDLPADLPSIEADANQLEAALLNLALNARDAMAGEGRITISGSSEILIRPAFGLPLGHYVRLRLSDTGSGMDETTLRRATDPFFTTKGVGKGTGLGLSMVHVLAIQTGGTLVLKSTLGEGTTAEVWLPAAEAQPPADVTPAVAVALEGSSTERRSLRVLAVDDDFLVLMNTTAMLEDMVHEAIEAHFGRNALDRLLPIQRLISSLHHAMPQMTGAQLITEIKSRWPHLPVLLATGYAEVPGGIAPDLPRLQKPFSQGDLQRAVSALVI